MIRVWLTVLTVLQGTVGAVQLLAPKTFYVDFPTSTHPWVSLIPPYNEHLMRDVGALTLAYVLVLAVATVTMDRLVIRTALAANLMFTVPHFVYHAAHLDGFPRADAIAQTIVLATGVVVPAALLYAISGRRANARDAAPVPQASRGAPSR